MVKKSLPILTLSIFSSMLGAGIIAPLLPLYADNLGASVIWIGIIFAAFSISRSVFIPIFGRLSDSNGRKVFLSIGLFSFSVISLGYIWADSVQGLTLVRLVQGAAGVMVILIAQAYVGDISPEGEEGRKFGMGSTLGVFAMAFSIGMAIGPLLGGFMADVFNLNSAFYISAAAGLVGTALLIWFTRNKPRTT